MLPSTQRALFVLATAAHLCAPQAVRRVLRELGVEASSAGARALLLDVGQWVADEPEGGARSQDFEARRGPCIPRVPGPLKLDTLCTRVPQRMLCRERFPGPSPFRAFSTVV